MRRVWYLVQKGDITNAYKILVRESKGIDPLGSNRHRYMANITIILKE
jgi:hypothetical protein